MNAPITLEDIFQLFERQKEETERRATEADRRAESKAEADRRHAKLEKLVVAANTAVNSELNSPSILKNESLFFVRFINY